MSILLNNHGGDNASWARAINEYLPAMDIQVFPNIDDPQRIEYAVVWEHPHGDLIRYPNLKAILVLGAGMDHIDQETTLPDVPIVRLIDPSVGDEMSQYALYWVMHFQRGYQRYRQQQDNAFWQRHMTPWSRDYRVSVLGAGPIGCVVAERLAINGFAVRSWSRSKKHIDKVETLNAEEGLDEILRTSDVLINCLPLKPATRHLLNLQNLLKLPEGSNLISISRGAVIDDEALLELLDRGHIANAALDTFASEPLPQTSFYWNHPNVYVTPHMSGSTYPMQAAEVICNNIQRVERGELPFPIYQRE